MPVVLPNALRSPGVIYQQDNSLPHIPRFSIHDSHERICTPLACQVARTLANRALLRRAWKTTAAIREYW
ncbi:hypothetical protein TNCV_2342971 [Trichonephila clavipes]|nr:hypothetical protein TNCV_2342971 [Trichonephila clavipes]